MAVWRMRAYSEFHLKPGDYSYPRGKRELSSDLVEWARAALDERDDTRLLAIVDYVTWAAAQHADDLSSAVDLAFFLPVFRDPQLSVSLTPHFPQQLIAAKRRLLMREQP